MHGPTMQCIGKTYYQTFQLFATVPNLCPKPKSLSSDRLINDHLAAGMLDEPSFRRRLNSSISRTEF